MASQRRRSMESKKPKQRNQRIPKTIGEEVREGGREGRRERPGDLT